MSNRMGILLGLLAFLVTLTHAWSSLSPSYSTLSKKFSRNPAIAQKAAPAPTDATTPTSLFMTHDKNTEFSKGVNGDDSASVDNPRGGGTGKKTARKYNVSVICILASAFLNLLGFTMAGPITPALGQHFELQVGSKFGSLTSAYPLGMLLGLFVWPQLSDSIGRKPVITFSLLGSGLGLATQAFAIYSNWGLLTFLLTRVLTGAFAGASPVSKAFLADVGTAQGKLPRYLALRDAAATMAFIVGPMLGGLLFDNILHHVTGAEQVTTTTSLSFVIGISAAASLAAAALVGIGVKEIRPQKQTSSQPTRVNKEIAAASCPLGVSLWAGVATVCIVSFLFNVGDSTFHAFFPSLLKEKLSMDARAIGLAYTVFACISFAMSATVAGPSIQRNGAVTSCAMGLLAISCGLFALGGCSGNALLGAAALYYSGVPLYGPTIPTMLLQCVPSNKRGAVMGLDVSCTAVSVGICSTH
jgi:MFS family permease